jgi:hypothetical protein
MVDGVGGGAATVVETTAARFPAGDGTPVSVPPRFIATAAVPAERLATTAMRIAMVFRVNFMCPTVRTPDQEDVSETVRVW